MAPKQPKGGKVPGSPFEGVGALSPEPAAALQYQQAEIVSVSFVVHQPASRFTKRRLNAEASARSLKQ